MKPINVKSSTYIDFGIENNDKDPKFEVGDHVLISKHRNIFAKVYAPILSEGVFMIKKVKNCVPWTYIMEDLNDEEIVGMLYEKELQKTKNRNVKVFNLMSGVNETRILVHHVSCECKWNHDECRCECKELDD